VTRKVERVLEHAEVVAAAFSPDGTRVVTASADHTARVWDARTGKPLTEPLAHQDAVRVAAFSPDGTRVVTASSGLTARVCARVWPLRLDRAPLEDWQRSARCDPFTLDHGVLIENHAPLTNDPNTPKLAWRTCDANSAGTIGVGDPPRPSAPRGIRTGMAASSTRPPSDSTYQYQIIPGMEI
jgi:WD40 repeat protein